MTTIERKAILYLIQSAARPSVSHGDIALLDSPQFVDGWTQAHIRYKEILEWLAGNHNAEDLKRYARQYREAEKK